MATVTGTATPRGGDNKDTTISLKIGGVGRNDDEDGRHGAAANDGLWHDVGG